MSAELRYRAKPEIIVTEMDGEMVALDADQGLYFGIGGVGARVWELLREPASLDSIVRTICAEYEVDEATCSTQMQDFIQELVGNGIVEAI